MNLSYHDGAGERNQSTSVPTKSNCASHVGTAHTSEVAQITAGMEKNQMSCDLNVTCVTTNLKELVEEYRQEKPHVNEQCECYGPGPYPFRNKVEKRKPTNINSNAIPIIQIWNETRDLFEWHTIHPIWNETRGLFEWQTTIQIRNKTNGLFELNTIKLIRNETSGLFEWLGTGNEPWQTDFNSNFAQRITTSIIELDYS